MRIIKITAIVVICVAAIIGGLVAYNKLSLGKRLVSSLQEHVLDHKEFFTEAKLTQKYEDFSPFNIQGDGEIGGTFQLSKQETAELLAANDLLTCSGEQDCTVEVTEYPDKPERCVAQRIVGGIIRTLCINRQNSQAKWRVFWY